MTFVKREWSLEGAFGPLVISIPPGTAPNQRDRYRNDDRNCADQKTNLSGSHFKTTATIDLHIM